jgi:hypothetical protein
VPSWREVEGRPPELSALARTFFDAFTHKTLATLRRDGSPRISGTELELSDGEAWLGSMWRAVKALDLQRDPRFALHSGSDEPSQWKGDAKLAGVAEEITDPEKVRRLNGAAAENGPSHLFRLDVREVSTVRLAEGGKELEIDIWTPEGGVRTIRRA